jgi:hypothetical protein
MVESGDGETRIENIRVGDTISGAQYGCVDTPEEVYEVKLVARNTEGEIVGMTLLRDREWVDENVQGDVAELDFPEGPRVGPAAVVAVTRTTAPARACGLVTGTFQRLAFLTLALVLAGGETLQVTPEHPVYSTDRDGWVAAAEVAAGELLATEDGEIRVLSTTPVVGPVWVHNLEVAGAHEYFVGGARIRAHNDCGNSRPTTSQSWENNSAPNRGRPSPRDSEAEVERLQERSHPGQVNTQQSYRAGQGVTHGQRGSVRPDVQVNGPAGEHIEVKNYNLGRGLSRLYRVVERQVRSRAANLPRGATQSLVIDIRGQDVSNATRAQIAAEVQRRTNGAIPASRVTFLNWDNVR